MLWTKCESSADGYESQNKESIPCLVVSQAFIWGGGEERSLNRADDPEG